MTEDNVINFSGVTRLDIDADRVLKSAVGRLDKVVIVGFDKDGDEYFASSVADGGTTLWLMERAKLKLLRVADSDD